MKDIKYTLRGVSIDQFATPFEPSTNDFDVNVNIPIKTNYQEGAIAIGANVQFLEKGKVFMVAEAFCHYLVEPGCWSELSEDNSKDVFFAEGVYQQPGGNCGKHGSWCVVSQD